MTRRGELAVLAGLLAEPARSRVRQALEGLRAGVFARDAVAGLARARHTLRWIALLLALETAELRLGGAVRFGTPRTRFAPARCGGELFEECWGAFGVTAWPEGVRARLEVVAGPGPGYRLVAQPLSQDAARSAVLSDALAVLRRELGDYLGREVRVVEAA